MGPTVRLAVTGVRRRGAGQVVVLVLVTALAAAAIVAGLASRTTAATLLDDAYQRAGRPDVVLFGTPDALRAAATDPDVAAASEPAQRAEGETIIDGETEEIAVTAVDPDALPAVGTPDLVAGRWPTARDEVVVEQSLVTEGVTDVGDTVEMTTRTGTFAFEVVGSAIELTDCFWPTCTPVRVFGLPELVANVGAGSDPIHVASYRLVNPEADVAVGARLLRDGGPQAIFGQMAWSDTRGDILIVGEVFGAMVGGFGAFLLMAACFVVAGATAARLVARRRTLGLLRAVGFRPRQLVVAMLGEHAIIGAAGVALGWALGSLVAPQLSGAGRVLDADRRTFEAGPLLTALLLVEAFLALAVVVPSWRAGRQPATEVLRDVPTAPTGGRAVAAAARRLGAGPSLVAGLRRAVARPVRAALATAAVLVAAIGAVVTAGFIATVDGAVADPARIGTPFDAVAVPTGLSHDELAAVLDDTPEVAAWYTEREATATIGRASFRTRVLGGDPAAAGFDVREGRAVAGPGEAMAGYGFLDAAGLEIGDRVEATIAGAVVDVELVGWYLDAEDTGEMLVLREESLPPDARLDPPMFNLVAADGVERDAVTAAVADRVGSGAHVVTEDPGDLAGIAAVKGTLIGFAGLLAAVAAANLLATTVAATRERARALGVLRTVGCTTGQLVAQSAAGAGFLGFVAGIVGVPIGSVVFRALSDGITAGVGIGPGLGVSPSAWFLVAVVPSVTLLAAAAGGLASLGLSRRPAAELVRYE
jgi:putative ABC transport system permease protein